MDLSIKQTSTFQYEPYNVYFFIVIFIKYQLNFLIINFNYLILNMGTTPTRLVDPLWEDFRFLMSSFQMQKYITIVQAVAIL